LPGDDAHAIFAGMKHLHLLSTDFDGTLIGFSSDGVCGGAFAEVLTEHRRHGGLWAINTGRSLQHAIDGLARFGAPSLPDFLLTNEREVFRRCREGQWEAHGDWNEHCTRQHDALHEKSLEVIRRIEALLAEFPGSQIISENGRSAGLITANEEQMEQVASELPSLARDLPEFSFQRNTIYLRFCHVNYDKGSALAELCRLEGIQTANVFCAGDHMNDLSMLTPERAGMLACPSNAIPQIQEAVLQGGGYVAKARYGDGVAEGILHHAENPGNQISHEDTKTRRNAV
jgi:hydroxymethylpyrimidine pyrophosphatase-like HAD family hydrolase